MEEILQSTEIKWRFPIHQFRYMYNEIQTGFPGSARKIKQKKVYIYILFISQPRGYVLCLRSRKSRSQEKHLIYLILPMNLWHLSLMECISQILINKTSV